MTFGESATFMKGVTSSDDEARRVFDRALEHGVNLIDTANVYSEGRSEELVGQWSAGKRHKVLIATKCRFPVGFGLMEKPGPHDMGLSRKHIVAACEQSLSRLKTDFIDLYQVHMQDTTVRIDETLRALDDLVTAGKVRYVGCSNYTGYRLMESLWSAEKNRTHRYESVQLQWSLLERGAEREVVPVCREYKLGVLVWSPLASGFLTGKYRRGQAPPAGARLAEWKDTMARLGQERSYDLLDRLAVVAQRREASSAQVALAWLLAKPTVSSVILGARTIAQLDDNLRAIDVKLTPEDVKELDEASAPDWAYPYAFIGRQQVW
ncbi:Oxidoreductase [Labilithrix luteola]|uniref:Oxidoreductase n=2 Tax=Labilithrix luteola TaxID=1391654 RepID=A0A0K1QBT2_9BACT|nr:Oxidoreductase [Labilithrix luteola]